MKKYRQLNVKISFLFLVLLILVALLVGESVYHLSYSRSIESNKDLLTVCGMYSADIINPTLADKWLSRGPDEAYRITEKDLLSIKQDFALSDLFIYKPLVDEDGELKNEATFIFDIMADGETVGSKMELGQKESGLIEYELLKKVYESGQPEVYEGFKPKQREELFVVFVPMKLDNGEIYAIVGVTCPMEKVKTSAQGVSITMVSLFAAIIIIFAAVIILFIKRSIIKPVKILSDRMNNFVSGENKLHYVPITEIHTRDEIEQMSDNFNSMASSIVKYTNDLEVATAAHERMRAELDVAGSIRSAVSADNTYPVFAERSDFELFASLKNTVYNSCSFCDYIMTAENHLYIVVGESVGKTLPALLMSMLASASIRCLAEMGVEPYRIAAKTNDHLCGFERNDKSMTVCALIVDIDLDDGTMRYINAGMPPMLIKFVGEPYRSEEDSIQYNLGEMRSVSFEQKTVQLHQGNTIILTSHGVAEMKNSDGENFSRKRIEYEVNRIASQKYCLEDMIAELEFKLDSFRCSRPNELDTTIVGFRYFG